ncbi:MAG: penicillin-binding protein 2 [Solirubrobacteraceae bacterium]|nr:penicillin-binding protein 2 [Solirubrobacteraceae bacterium]
MPPTLEERRPAITPQLAMRVALLGGFAFVLFAVVFFRLWFLQVLSGQDYVSQARENRVRKVRIEAPRGNIVDRNGVTLVKTRVAPVVEIVPSLLPPAELKAADAYRVGRAKAEGDRLKAGDQLNSLERELNNDGKKATRAQRRERVRLARASRTAAPVAVPPLDPSAHAAAVLYRRLGKVIGVSPKTIHQRVVEGVAETPYSNVTIKTDVPAPAFNYLRERKELFPGVSVEKLYLRSYPHNTLAAQLFGTLGEISPQQLKERRYKGVAAGTRIGTSGVEDTYDSYLRGTDGYTKVVINALGNRDDRRQTTRVEPKQGSQLRLTLDLGLEKAAQSALGRAISAASVNGAKAGAYVAMDPRNGEVLALGSYPSFNANVFAKPLSQKQFDQLNSQANGAPLFNRAIAGVYPTGSTFKPVTAMAVLESGVITPSTTIVDNGTFKLGPQTYVNAKNERFGALQLVSAIKVSSDVFFYDLGNRANSHGPIIQDWARKLGIGRKTGIDIPGEFSGLVPDAAWRNKGYDAYLKCTKKAHVTAGTTQALYKCGGIERPWSAGDNVNLAVGQGDLQATPLQLAEAYSTIVNGGKVVRPHLGLQVEDGAGRLIEQIRKPIRRKVSFNPANRAAIMEGLKEAAGSPHGTSYDVFKGFPYPVYGKTGTAERGLNPDQSWYAAYVPDPSRPLVVVTTIERGGFGAETAAPAARLILDNWFHLNDTTFHAGSSQTR